MSRYERGHHVKTALLIGWLFAILKYERQKIRMDEPESVYWRVTSSYSCSACGHGRHHERLLAFFSSLQPRLDWTSLPDRSTGDVQGDRALLTDMIKRSAFGGPFVVDLTRAAPGICVAKVIVLGAKYLQGFFVRRAH